MLFRSPITTVLLLIGSVTTLHAQDSPSPESPAAAAPADVPTDMAAAIEFLSLVETHNADLRNVTVSFDQTRRDFLEEVSSEGTFWYQAPNRFHATYKSKHSAMYWMTDRELIEYNPSLKQVDIIPLGQGDEAPINQLLLGFGVKVAEITELFEARRLADAEKGGVVIELTSKDLARTLDYRTIIITFAEDSFDPKTILLDDGQSELFLEFNRIVRNGRMDEKLFEPTWPANTDVIRHSRT